MNDANIPGAAVRNHHRQEGADAVRIRIIEALNEDAVLSFTVSAKLLEHIVKIVEETK